MFIHEAKLSVRLSHANIVQVFDLGLAPTTMAPGVTPSDAYYMAMEYVNGPDLATLLGRARKTGAPLPIDTGVYVCAEVAKGLDHAHRRRDESNRPLGVVHRDVSPQNVLLSLEGEVKVADFGIAKARGVFNASSEDTSSRTIQGKFAYMSPEQVRGTEVDPRSDLFSLGIVLYECIAGANPFSSASTFETLRRVQACEYPPVELLRPDTPPELVAIQKMAMTPRPEDRYQDAGSMYEALLAFLYGQGRRYGAHQLSELLTTFRRDEDSLAPASIEGPLFDHEPGLGQNDRTPLELPFGRMTGGPSSRPMTADFKVGDRPTDRGERREVTALALELPRRARTRSGQARPDREDLEDESARAAAHPRALRRPGRGVRSGAGGGDLRARRAGWSRHRGGDPLRARRPAHAGWSGATERRPPRGPHPRHRRRRADRRRAAHDPGADRARAGADAGRPLRHLQRGAAPGALALRGRGAQRQPHAHHRQGDLPAGEGRARTGRGVRSLRRTQGRAAAHRRGAGQRHQATRAYPHGARRPRGRQDAALLRGGAAAAQGGLQRRLVPGDLSAARARVSPVGDLVHVANTLRRGRRR